MADYLPDLGTNDMLTGMWETALSVNTAQVPYFGNTTETVTGDAIQAQQPVSQAGVQAWSGFWQDLLKTTVGYTLAKDAAQNRVPAPVYVPSGAQALPAQRRQNDGGLLLLLAAAGVVYAVAK